MPSPGALLAALKRRLYPGGRPSPFARILNRAFAWQHSAGILTPPGAATLVVPGRRSGRQISFPVVLAGGGEDSYVVAMLGEHANWVSNVRAAGGRARLLRHGRQQKVRLIEVPAVDRAPILRRYLELAPGARPHLPVGRGAPLAAFAAVAGRYPVFRVATAG